MTSSLGALETLVEAPGGLKMAGSRHRWSKEGTKALIRAVDGCSHMALLMGSTTAPNVGIWRGVLEGMGQHGTDWTVEQLRSKWKGLKAAFHVERAHRASTGHPSRKTPIGYRRLLQMWTAAGQPTFGDRRSTVAMMVPQPPHRRRQRQRARPLSPEEEEEDEENQPATSGTPRGEEEPPTSPGTATEVLPPSPGTDSPLPPSPVQGMAEEEDALLPSATSTQDMEVDADPQQPMNLLLLDELAEQQELLGQQQAVMAQMMVIMQRQHHQTSRLLQLLRRTQK